MPLKSYGVFKGRAIDRRLGAGGSPHYQVHLVDQSNDYRIAVNVASQLQPSELEYLIDSEFRHPIVEALHELTPGWKALPSEAGRHMLWTSFAAICSTRGGCANWRSTSPGPTTTSTKRSITTFNAPCQTRTRSSMPSESAGDPRASRTRSSASCRANGVHDIHMNQANVGSFVEDDGVYQDGALLLEFPGQKQWVGVFLKFQSQTWHSDDHTGHQTETPTSGPPSDGGGTVPSPFDPGGQPTPAMPDGAVRIVAALVNPVQSPEVEYVTLLNTTNQAIDLRGWKIADRDKNKMALSGSIPAGETLRVKLVPPVMLPNKGGIITVLNEAGLRVDGVSYTKAQADNPGWTIKF